MAIKNKPHGDQIVLSVRHLKKKIGRKWIIKDVSFDIRAGEVFGFLGPNGSGKTTTIRMLVDLIRPTEGSIQLCGKDVHKEHYEALQHVGCIVENPELYPFLTGWENLEHFAAMLPNVSKERIRETVEIVGMDQRIHDKVKTYSLGMRQRLGIAQALLGSPKLLILDEPTNGLDPQGIKEMREFIRRLAETGLSVFVSSHLLSEIQLMCDRVAIIRKGEVIAVGTVAELLAQPFKRVRWKVAPVELALERMRSMLSAKDAVSAVNRIATDEQASDSPTAGYLLSEIDPEQVPALNQALMEAGVLVYGIETLEPTLEQLFLQVTEGERID